MDKKNKYPCGFESMNKKGIALILGFMVITILTILSVAILSRSISESRIVQRHVESIQAFWLAEAGVNRALDELRSNYAASGTNLWSSTLGQGGYFDDVADVTINEQSCKQVTAHGFIPAVGVIRAERIIEVIMSRYIPPNFYDIAVYSAGNVDFNGNSFSVVNNEPAPDDKAVLYAGEFDVQKPENITGTYTQDTSISPLALLDFQQILTISQGQGNVYDAARLDDVKKGRDSFPASFWYSLPIDPSDPATGVPNVIYVEDDLTLNGSIGTIGGFFVVAGDVITNPSAVYDATINGNGQIQGAIYTRGEFNINGGGGGLNVDGGVWAGQEVGLNGNASITYNNDYMLAIEALSINPNVQVNSWRDTQNPYTLTP